ncbi:MAG: FAD-dependent oxidoreductase [Elusimicrobia bacterium]|nr:FAD-dependent oxidoreductase [Elusimicrobiota bacterium]
MGRIVVVGGGLGGIACAVRLAHAGHEVTLIDQNERLGGKMNLIKANGFVFDTGPTILTMPQVLDRLFSAVGRRRVEYLELIRLDPQWRAFFEDGTTVDVWDDPEEMRREVRRVSPGDETGYLAFRAYAQEKFNIAERFFFWRGVAGVRDLLILCSIHHIQLTFGVWYPIGGTNRVAAALTQLAEECGVRFQLGDPVDRFVCQGGSVTGVEVRGTTILVDAVVANTDFVRTHRELLPFTRTRRRIERTPKRYEPSCSGIVIYFGVDRRYEVLRHHNFFFSKDPSREFEDIYHRKVSSLDPTLCVCAPSRTDPSVAPAGCENVYVLVHTPYLQGTEHWENFRKSYRDGIIAKLERCGLTGFREHIRVERWMTPNDLETRYRVDRGAIYGMASHGRLRGGFKPSNRSPDFQNLYFCGGSVHPGPGVPMALMSGQIAADCVLSDFGMTSKISGRP